MIAIKNSDKTQFIGNNVSVLSSKKKIINDTITEVHTIFVDSDTITMHFDITKDCLKMLQAEIIRVLGE